MGRGIGGVSDNLAAFARFEVTANAFVPGMAKRFFFRLVAFKALFRLSTGGAFPLMLACAARQA